MLPHWVLPSLMLTECEVWAMIFYLECWLSVEMVLWFVGDEGSLYGGKYSVARAEEMG